MSQAREYDSCARCVFGLATCFEILVELFALSNLSVIYNGVNERETLIKTLICWQLLVLLPGVLMVVNIFFVSLYKCISGPFVRAKTANICFMCKLGLRIFLFACIICILILNMADFEELTPAQRKNIYLRIGLQLNFEAIVIITTVIYYSCSVGLLEPCIKVFEFLNLFALIFRNIDMYKADSLIYFARVNLVFSLINSIILCVNLKVESNVKPYWIRRVRQFELQQV